MAPFRFNFEKTLQAVAMLLRQSRSGSANYMRLIKLLYIADRECLKETGRPITGDIVVAMQRGPVLSHVLDLIKDNHVRSSEWRKHVRRDNYHVGLIHDPGNGKLSRHEIGLLQRVWAENAYRDEWAMVELTHKFQEWQKNDPGENSSKVIPLSDIVDAIGLSAELARIEEEAEEANACIDLLGV